MILLPSLFAFALRWNAAHPDVAGVPRQVATAAEAAARQYDVPAALLLAIAQVESQFNPRAVSPAGARGIMQIMPSTARFMHVADVFSIRDSMLGAARYLGGLIRDGMRPADAIFTYTTGHPGTPWQVAHSGYVQAVFHDYRALRSVS